MYIYIYCVVAKKNHSAQANVKKRPCADFLVRILVQIFLEFHYADTFLKVLVRVLVRALCVPCARFLSPGALCKCTHPNLHKETGFPCAVLVRNLFRYNFVSLQYSTY